MGPIHPHHQVGGGFLHFRSSDNFNSDQNDMNQHVRHIIKIAVPANFVISILDSLRLVFEALLVSRRKLRQRKLW